MPITWKNVAAPRFGASNALLVAGNKGISNAFQGLGDTLKGASERIKGENTEEGMAAISAMSNLDTFDRDKLAYLDSIKGKNINESTIAGALDTRGAFLRQKDSDLFARNNRVEDRDITTPRLY